MRLEQLKNFITGLLLSFQFFTSIPVRKNLSMNEKSITTMYGMLPIISGLMGLTMVGLVYLNDAYFSFTPLFLAVLIVVSSIVMTGGLHLDGLIDVGDAFFSYRDKERRLEILSDSRIGAFGAICLVVFLMLKTVSFYEIFTKQPEHYLYFFIFIPIISRIGMLVYFKIGSLAKDTGLAAYFKKQVNGKGLTLFIVFYFIVVLVISVLLKLYIVLLLCVAVLLFVLLYKEWTKRHFGGMTGDLLGAFYEGVELVLWLIVLLYIS